MFVLGVVSLFRLQAIDQDLVAIDEHRIPGLHAANELNTLFLTIRVSTALAQLATGLNDMVARFRI